MITYPMPEKKGKIRIFQPRVCAGCVERNVNMQLALTIIQLLCALALVVIVLFQSGKSAGLSGAIAGAADTFMARNKSRSIDAKLAKSTKWIAIAFVILTIVLNIIA